MSGAGRNGGYRKSVTTSYENDYPIPCQEKQECIGKVRGNRGTNIFEFELANGSVELARMPNKFKKVIWVKRNDYIIVQSLMISSIPTATTFTSTIEGSKVEHCDITVRSEDEAKVKYEIIHILNKEQIKHIRENKLWPVEYVDYTTTSNTMTSAYDNDDIMPEYQSDEYYEDEEVVEEEGQEATNDE